MSSMYCTAVVVAGTGSMGGILGVCIGKFRKFLRANPKTRENLLRWQRV